MIFMYSKEIKDNFTSINTALKNINTDFTDIKILVHSLDKLGINMDDFYKQLDNLGIEIKKLKDMNLEKFMEVME